MLSRERLIRSIDTAIHSTLDGYYQIVVGYKDAPCEGSIAAKEHQGSMRQETIETGFSLATIAISYSADHLRAFATLVKDPEQTMAPFTCIRSMLEMGAIGAWVIDPSISERERIGRIFARRYRDIEEQLKITNRGNIQNEEVLKAELRIRQLVAESLEMGYESIQSKGKTCGAGVRHPGATEVIKSVLNAEIAYRSLSMLAHGNSTGVKTFGFKKLDDRHSFVRRDFGRFDYYEKKANPIAILAACSYGLQAFARVTWNKFNYYGWSTLQYEEILESAADKSQMLVEHRFWRS